MIISFSLYYRHEEKRKKNRKEEKDSPPMSSCIRLSHLPTNSHTQPESRSHNPKLTPDVLFTSSQHQFFRILFSNRLLEWQPLPPSLFPPILPSFDCTTRA